MDCKVLEYNEHVLHDSVNPWAAACQDSLSITNSQSLLKLTSFEPVMPSNHLILCCPNLLPPSIFPSIRVFSNVFSSVQSLSRVRLFATPWTAARQASLSITSSWSLPRLMSIESVMPSNRLISVVPSPLAFNLSQHQGFFQMSQLFASGGQNIGVSASTWVLPMNTEDWFSLGRTGWISLQSKGLSRVFSNTSLLNYLFGCCPCFLLFILYNITLIFL